MKGSLKKKTSIFLFVVLLGGLAATQFSTCVLLGSLHYHPFWRNDCKIPLPCTDVDRNFKCVKSYTWGSNAVLKDVYQSLPEAKLTDDFKKNLTSRLVKLAHVIHEDAPLNACSALGKKGVDEKWVPMGSTECQKNFSGEGWNSYKYYTKTVTNQLQKYSEWEVRLDPQAVRFYDDYNGYIVFVGSGDAINHAGDVGGMDKITLVALVPKTEITQSADTATIAYWRFEMPKRRKP